MPDELDEQPGQSPGQPSGERDDARPRRLRGFRQERRPGSPRPHVHKVKVSEDQERLLLLLAAQHGNVSVPRLLVESALAGGSQAAVAKADLAGELFRITRFLGKVGVNVNQIARATNATGETQPETAAAMAAVQRVCARIEDLLVELEQVGPR